MFGFKPANILLPKKDFEKWSVIACDQYTSQGDYWKDVEDVVGDCPSTLRITLPEYYLSDNKELRIEKINENMETYLTSGVFDEFSNSYIYTERTLKDGKVRKGIIGVIDLEEYEFTDDAKSLIRCTEKTSYERVKPRIEIRKDATIELPHVLVLVDDPNMNIIEPFSKLKASLKKVYDFNLMKDSGALEGYLIDEKYHADFQTLLKNLVSESEDKMLFAVGDGNHSLATAKECYKLNPNPLNRYALVEVVNIHDSSLEFEPIYRALFNVEPENVINDIISDFGGEYFGLDAQIFTCVYGDKQKEISLKPTMKLPIGTLQTYLDEYMKKHTEIEIDYIHGIEATKEISKKDKTLGFIFEGMQKSELFDAVRANGPLPRKTFSMGCADDKRFYLECRKIK